jgi:hypothetical protein
MSLCGEISEGCPVPQRSGALAGSILFLFLPPQVQSSKSRFVPNGCIQLSQHCTNTRHELSLLLGTIILKEPGMESVIEELKMYAMPSQTLVAHSERQTGQDGRSTTTLDASRIRASDKD